MTTLSLGADGLRHFLSDNFKLYDWIDLRIDQLTPTSGRASLPLNENTGNHFNVIHAALQFALCELTGALVLLGNFNPSDYLVVATELQIGYHKPARGDVSASVEITQDQLEQMRVQLDEEGKLEFSTTVELRDTNQNVATRCQCSYLVRRIVDLG